MVISLFYLAIFPKESNSLIIIWVCSNHTLFLCIHASIVLIKTECIYCSLYFCVLSNLPVSGVLWGIPLFLWPRFLLINKLLFRSIWLYWPYLLFFVYGNFHRALNTRSPIVLGRPSIIVSINVNSILLLSGPWSDIPICEMLLPIWSVDCIFYK